VLRGEEVEGKGEEVEEKGGEGWMEEKGVRGEGTQRMAGEEVERRGEEEEEAGVIKNQPGAWPAPLGQ
jgi:hypothetical protein